MKKMFTILSLVSMIMLTSTVAFAADSEVATTIEPTTTENSTSEGPTTKNGGNNSPISPQTGDNTSTAFAFVLLFTSMGTAVLAKKKLSE